MQETQSLHWESQVNDGKMTLQLSGESINTGLQELVMEQTEKKTLTDSIGDFITAYRKVILGLLILIFAAAAAFGIGTAVLSAQKKSALSDLDALEVEYSKLQAEENTDAQKKSEIAAKAKACIGRCRSVREELMTGKKSVNLVISNNQYSESLEPKGETFTRELNLEDNIELTTEGFLYNKGRTMYIAYDETEDAGLQNTKTIIKLEGNDKLRIRRYGKDEDSGMMDMQLEEGILNITKYVIPAGNLEMEIYTNKIETSLDDEGYGKIFADYKIKMEPFINVRNKLEIEVKPS